MLSPDSSFPLRPEPATIALIGIGCRYAGGAVDSDTTWKALSEGTDPVRTVPANRWDVDAWYDPDPSAPGKTITRQGAFLKDIDAFDANRFGISPREATQLDPQQRLLLEVAWQALEDAALAPDQLAGKRVGLYVGMGMTDYARRSFLAEDPSRIDAYAGTGAFTSVAAGRVAYTLGLRGPAMAIHTACSSSLVAVHLATQALRAGEIDIAIAGGVNLLLAPQPSVYFSKLGALSADGRCHTFSNNASGYGRGEGCGLVVLTTQQAARTAGRRVWAWVRGSALNQDGRSNGLTAPSGEAQQEVIRAALADAGVDASEVGLIEAHGTGTPLGDPIEIDALKAVYGAGENPCAVRSVKTLFAHTEAAAGVAGLIAATLALRHRTVPPHLHLEALNPRITLDGTRLSITADGGPTETRFAGISAFGLAGTNAHVILERADPGQRAPQESSEAGPQLMVLSAGSDEGVQALAGQVTDALAGSDLAQVAWTLAHGRAALSHRMALVADSPEDARERLEQGRVTRGRARRPEPIVFAYTGQGSQWLGMGQALYQSQQVFREAVDDVDRVLLEVRGIGLAQVLWGEDDALLTNTLWTQPALYAIGLGLTALWRSWGIEPDAVLGHSVGEITAATVAGVLTVDEGARLVAERARLMGGLAPGGSMAAIAAPVAAIKPALESAVQTTIAAANSPRETVISGPAEEVRRVVEALEKDGLETRILRVSHAFHSPLVEPILEAFEAVAETITYAEPTVSVFSNVTGKEAGAELGTSRYWREHIRRPVRFESGLRAAWNAGYRTFIEIGPHPVLAGMGAATLPQSTWLPSLRRNQGGPAAMLESLATLFTQGHNPNRTAVWAGTPGTTPLPHPAFERQRFWLEPLAHSAVGTDSYRITWEPAEPAPRQFSGVWYVDEPTDGEALVAALGAHGVDARLGAPGKPLETGEHLLLGIAAQDEPSPAWRDGPERVRHAWHLRGKGQIHLWTRAGAAEEGGPQSLSASMCIGLSRVLAVEDPDRFGGLVQVHPDTTVDAGLRALSLGEDRVAAWEEALWVPRLQRGATPRAEPDLSRGCHLITGAFGAVGQAVCARLVQSGATDLFLVSRGGAEDPQRSEFVGSLQREGVRVQVAALDISDGPAVTRLVDSLPELTTVFHCAGTVVPGAVGEQSADSFAASSAAKVHGAWNLHRATADRDLTAFVLFSSIAAAWGSAGLGGYAAANGYLDGLAQQRRVQGKPGLSVSWGPWADGGMVGAEDRRQFARMGIRALAPDEALDTLLGLFDTRGHRVVADVDWERFLPVFAARAERPFVQHLAPAPATAASTTTARSPLDALPPDQQRTGLRDALAREVREVLGLPPGSEIDPTRGFFDLGLDSLMAVELHRRLRDRLGLALPATVVLDHPDLDALTDRAATALGWQSKAAIPLPVTSQTASHDIAIIGVGCRFPGADSPDAFFQSLWAGEDQIGPAPARAGGSHGAFLTGIDLFDAEFFGIAPDEAAAMDPQQRLWLQVSWEALERSGQDPDRLRGSDMGVFIGVGRSGYWDRLRSGAGPESWPWAGVGNEQSFAAGRVAYTLGLRGPALAVNTACSSSLVAIHLAVESLRTGRCTQALAGGVNLLLSPRDSAWLEAIGALSQQGRCATFDAAADGYVRSEGCGVLVLKPLQAALADGDPVLAVIRGTAVGHGGAASGITVPNGPAQVDVIRRALADAGAQPEDVGFVECHGTGTALGDPIEVGALGDVFGNRAEPLVLGALKTQIGHAETAAGVAGVIKAIGVLQTSQAPPNLHLDQPNPALDLSFGATLPAEITPVRGLAGVSSFGISGTNAHLVLAPPPRVPPSDETEASAPFWLLPISTDDPAQLARVAEGVRATNASAEAIGYSLAVARPQRRTRMAVVMASDRSEEISPSHSADAHQAREGLRVGLLFTGQGAQLPGMGLDLDAQLPCFREALDRVDAALRPHLGRSIRQVLADPNVHHTSLAQPALFALSWSLATTLESLGLRPTGLAGHSLGEWTAAVVGGVLTLEEGARIVCARGAAMGACPEGGAMCAVEAPEAVVQGWLDQTDSVSLAAVNGPNDCVVSGPLADVQGVRERAESDGRRATMLTVSHAFHSAAMDPALTPLADALATASLQPSRIPLFTTLDGERLGARAAEPQTWLDTTRGTVRFGQAVTRMSEHCDVLVELGPHPVLLGLAGRALSDGPTGLPTLRREQPELQCFLEAVGNLWARGAPIDLRPLYPRDRLAAIPTTAWRRTRHWIEAPEGPMMPSKTARLFEIVPAKQVPQLASVDLRITADHTAVSAVQAIRALCDNTDRITVEAPGALGLQGPPSEAAAAAVGAMAALRVERPDLETWLVDPDSPSGACWRPLDPPEPVSVSGTWLVTGASGALGRRLCTWLEEQGASVWGLSRSERPEGLAPSVHWRSVDVAEATALEEVLGEISSIAGVLHCAGVNRSALLGDLRDEDLEVVFRAKVGGARLLAERLPPSAHLVLFGSATAWLGLPGQAAYGAANAALDAIALSREGRTSCLSWGPWRAGMAGDGAVNWEELGVRPLSDATALATLAACLAPGAPRRVVAIDIDPDRFAREHGPVPELAELLSGPAVAATPTDVTALEVLVPAARVPTLTDWIRNDTQRVTGQDVEATQGFFEAGMDSLAAVELARRLGHRLDLKLPATVAFDHPTPESLARHLLAKLDLGGPAATQRRVQHTDEPIAVVGMACRFPGAPDVDAFWELLRSGGHAITEVPPDRWDLRHWYDEDRERADRMYTRHGAFLDEIDTFDPGLFGISPREAEWIDPQQRLLLETCWRALDDGASLNGVTSVGVFAGIAERGWLRRFEEDQTPYYRDAWAGTGSESSFAAGRVSHALGLRGPAVSLNTTCSSSLVAIHLAAQAIRRGDCAMALAGGVHLVLDPESTAYLCTLGALSPTGRCHTFDAAADGYVRGEGCGILLLKPLSQAREDGDRIHAILHGSATNHDGHASGLTVPSGQAQQEVIRSALANAGLGPEQIGWLQAHGTGTPLGDPIELAAAREVYLQTSRDPLVVGTVKTAIGHAELAAGAAGAIAAVLAVSRAERPPHPLQTPNPDLDLTGFHLPESVQPWPETDRYAGVSAFGLSGTNAHLIFGVGPKAPQPAPAPKVLWWPLAAHTEQAFHALVDQIEDLEVGPTSAALHRRAHLPLRAALVAPLEQRRSHAQILKPTRAGSSPRAAFLFTGQGSQWAGMHRVWRGLSAYDEMLARAVEAADPHLERPLLDVLEDDEALGHTAYTQPALWAVGVALAAQWRAWGVEPAALAGHSIGELTAATVAGALSLDDAAALVCARGRLMGDLPAGGAMAVVKTGVDVLEPFLDQTVVLAGVNDPGETVIAGLRQDVEVVLGRIEAAGHEVQRLRVSHAFHSHLLDPMLDPWEQIVSKARWRTPEIPLISSMTGHRVTDEPASPSFWRDHARNPVRFRDAMGTLSELGLDCFIECGPHPILVAMGRRTVQDPERALWLGSMRRQDQDPSEGLRSLGTWWERGGPVHFDAVHPSAPAHLPPYPMERTRLWPEGDRHRATAWTYGIDWVPAGPADPPAVSRWAVLGNHPIADALANHLDAARGPDPSCDGWLDLAGFEDKEVQDLIREAHAVSLQALDCGASVWWLTPQSTPELEALHAWVRSACAEHPELRGGWLTTDTHDPQALSSALGRTECVLRQGQQLVPRLMPQPIRGEVPELTGTWLVTGGLGGLGRHVARWLVGRGVRSVLLTARTPLPDREDWQTATGETSERVALIRDLEAQGVSVRVGAFDAGDLESLSAFLKDTVLTGALHLAGTTDPQRLSDADPDRQEAVLLGKWRGAVALDRWTRQHGVETLVFFGSIAAAWGGRELAAYSAANAAVGALARQRASEGLPGLCIDWGPWDGGGMVDSARAEALARMGQQPIAPQEALELLGRAIAADRDHIVAARVDWPRFLALAEATGRWSRFDALRPVGRPTNQTPVESTSPEVPRDAAEQQRWVEDTLGQLARQVLRLAPDADLPREQPLMELGFDSLMATELNNALVAEGIDVPLGRLLGGPSLEELTIMALARLEVVPETETDSQPEATHPNSEQARIDSVVLWMMGASFVVGAALATAIAWAWFRGGIG